jgi:hypothetical protein
VDSSKHGTGVSCDNRLKCRNSSQKSPGMGRFCSSRFPQLQQLSAAGMIAAIAGCRMCHGKVQVRRPERDMMPFAHRLNRCHFVNHSRRGFRIKFSLPFEGLP